MAAWAAGIGAVGAVAGGLLGSRAAKMSAEQKALLNAQTDQTWQQTYGLTDKNRTYNDVYNQTTGLGTDPSQYVAGLSPQQLAAMGLTSSSLGFGQKDSMGLSNTISGADYGNYGAKDINEFMDPYTNDVVNATNSDIDRARQQAIVGTEGAANSAGAFGGSRHGVADSLTNEAALRTTASTDANLRSEGFRTAAGLAQQRALQMGGFKVAGNAQLQQLIAHRYGMNSEDIARLMSSGNAQQQNDQQMKNWPLERLKMIQTAQGGSNGGGSSNNFQAPTMPNSFASTVQGANWGQQVGSAVGGYWGNYSSPGSYAGDTGGETSVG